MNGMQKSFLFIGGGLLLFFSWVFLRDDGSSQYVAPPAPQQQLPPTQDVPVPVAPTETSFVPTASPYQPETPLRPLGVYIPIEDACYKDDVIGVGSTVDIIWRVWFPRIVVVICTAIVVWLVWLGAQMYEHTTTLNNTYAILRETHDHDLELAKIRAAQPQERPINYTVKTRQPQTAAEPEKVIPVDEELVFYFAENAPERGLAIRDWEKVVGFDRQTINTIMEWLDKKAFLIEPPSPGKAAEWLNGRVPSPETIVTRLGFSANAFAGWLEMYLED